MKNIFKLGIFLLFFTFCGCGDDSEELFEGTDNYISSFVLTTADGGKYEAAIIGDQIIVTAPKNETFKDAKVEYKVSEQAQLFPSPADVSNWNSEQVFRVVSHNRTLKDYTYTVKRTAINSEGTIVLLTQSDVNAFAKTGITEIKGSLVLGSLSGTTEDPIKDLSPLSNITNVRYDIVINTSLDATSLVGLDNIVSAGGLTIGTAAVASNPQNGMAIVLSSLESLGQLQINSSQVTSLLLPKLKTVGNVYIDANMLSTTDFSSLEVCDGHFIVKATTANTYLTTLALPSLKQVRGNMQIEKYTKVMTLSLPKLTTVEGSIALTTLSAVTVLSLPELSQCGNSLTVTSLDKATKLSFPKLTTVPALSLSSSSWTALPIEKIEFPLLENVDKDLYIKLNSANLEILSFPALKKVGGKLDIEAFKNLTTLDIPQLAFIGTSLYLYGLNVLESIDITKINDLPSLELISCYKLATIKAPSELNNVTFNAGSTEGVPVPTFSVPTQIKGKLEVSNYKYSKEGDWTLKNVTRIDGTFTYSGSGSSGVVNLIFEDVETIRTFNIGSGYYFKSASFPKLTEVTERFEFDYTQYMGNGSISLPKLKKIKNLTFNGASYSGGASSFKLRTNLEDFANVTEIGEVNIKWWGALNDFSGLKNALPSLSASNWHVTENTVYNPTYQDMVDGKYTPGN